MVWLWISSGDIHFIMTLGWVVRAANMWASLGGGPVCILAIELHLNSVSLRSWSEYLGGQQGLWANFRKWVDNLWRAS